MTGGSIGAVQEDGRARSFQHHVSRRLGAHYRRPDASNSGTGDAEARHDAAATPPLQRALEDAAVHRRADR
jgi:hypothetical protein